MPLTRVPQDNPKTFIKPLDSNPRYQYYSLITAKHTKGQNIMAKAPGHRIHGVNSSTRERKETLCGRAFYPVRGLYPVVFNDPARVNCKNCIRRIAAEIAEIVK